VSCVLSDPCSLHCSASLAPLYRNNGRQFGSLWIFLYLSFTFTSRIVEFQRLTIARSQFSLCALWIFFHGLFTFFRSLVATFASVVLQVSTA